MESKGNGEDHVTWAQMERELNHLKELWAQQREALDTALSLQAREYERRLEQLNGEHARLRADRAESVRREVFEPWRDLINHDVDGLKAKAEAVATVNRWYWLVGGTILTALMWGLTYWRGGLR